jgi:hypothetical protein
LAKGTSPTFTSHFFELPNELLDKPAMRLSTARYPIGGLLFIFIAGIIIDRLGLAKSIIILVKTNGILYKA